MIKIVSKHKNKSPPDLSLIKRKLGSWELTAQTLFKLIETLPERDKIDAYLETLLLPKKSGRKSPLGTIKNGLSNIGLAIRDGLELNSNTEAAEYVLKKQAEYGYITNAQAKDKKSIRTIAKRISDADPKRTNKR